MIRSSPVEILFVLMRRVGWIILCLAGSLAANPLNLSLEEWDLKIADDPFGVYQRIQNSRHSLDPIATPEIYLRVLSMDCLARAQIGEELNEQKVIDEGLLLASRSSLWDEAILLTSCKARLSIKAGRHDEGRRLLEDAIHLAHQHGKGSLHIRSLVLLSNFHLSNNEMGKALGLLQQAEAILKNDQGLAEIEQERLKVEVAMGLEAAGSHDVGVEIHESALHYFKKHGLRSYQVIMHYNVAEYYAAQGNAAGSKKAREHFQAAADIALSLHDEMTYVYALTGIAQIEHQAKNYAPAEKLMTKAIDAFKGKDSEWWAESLILLSAIKKDQGKLWDALELLEKADSILPLKQGAMRETIKVRKEDIFLQLGRFKEAYSLRKEVSEARIEKLKSDAEKEYSKLKVDLGLSVEEEKASLLQAENERQKKISYYKTIATIFLGVLLLVLALSMIWLKIQHDKIKSMQKHIHENVLQRFLPPQIIEGILSGRSPLDDAAQETTVTILFCDLVDFTSSSERLGADKIARVLNQFFKEMTEEIFESGGTIDKFIGDAIMVLFGAPIHADAPIQAQKAFECGERILKRMQQLNERWRQEEDAEFDIRIGIHQGQAIVGSFGSQKRSDYTAIGLHVNIAARIETAARPNTIFFSASIAQHLASDRYVSVGPVRLRGVSEKLELYSNIPKPSDGKRKVS